MRLLPTETGMSEIRKYFAYPSSEIITFEAIEKLPFMLIDSKSIPGVTLKRIPFYGNSVVIELSFSDKAKIKRYKHSSFEIVTVVSGTIKDNVSGVVVGPGGVIRFRPETPHELEDICDGGQSKVIIQLNK